VCQGIILFDETLRWGGCCAIFKDEMRFLEPLPTPVSIAGLNIRPVAVIDLPAISRIYNVSVLQTATTFQIRPDSERERLAWFRAHEQAHGKHPAFVGEVDGEVVGWASLSPYCAREAWAQTVEDSVYLDERFHGRGYGTELLKHLLFAAKRAGHRVVLARIVAGHAASIGLHAKLGFVEVGRLTGVGYKFGLWHDVVYMEYDFGPDVIVEPTK